MFNNCIKLYDTIIIWLKVKNTWYWLIILVNPTRHERHLKAKLRSIFLYHLFSLAFLWPYIFINKLKYIYVCLFRILNLCFVFTWHYNNIAKQPRQQSSLHVKTSRQETTEMLTMCCLGCTKVRKLKRYKIFKKKFNIREKVTRVYKLVRKSHIQVRKSHIQVRKSHIQVRKHHIQVRKHHIQVRKPHIQVRKSHIQVRKPHIQIRNDFWQNL